MEGEVESLYATVIATTQEQADPIVTAYYSHEHTNINRTHMRHNSEKHVMNRTIAQ